MSTPVEPYVRLRLDQSRLDSGVKLENGTAVRLRPTYNPDCSVDGALTVEASGLLAAENTVLVTADISKDSAVCASSLPHGTALVARLSAPDRSIYERARLGLSRLLQDRLPINMNDRALPEK